MMHRRAVAALVPLLLFVGASSAEATHLLVSWTGKGIREVADPEVYGYTVFNRGARIGPNFPPCKGGTLILVNVVDRSASQIGYLDDNLAGPGTGKRYVLRNSPPYFWMYDEISREGFLTTTWNRIRGMIWDRRLNRTLADARSDYAKLRDKLYWRCRRDCDYEACASVSYGVPTNCDCEEWQGRIFCHIKDRFDYSADAVR